MRNAPREPRPVVVSVRDVTKRFVIRKDDSLKERIVTFGRGRRYREDFVALSHISVEIEAGSTIGLIGHNGSGKSTLLKIIGGIISPSDGEVLSRGRIAALLELGAGFHPDLSGRENVYLNGSILGLSRAEIDERFDDIVEFSGIGDFINSQVKFYSSGMYVRLAFAVAVHTDPDILLIDEVLSVGDEAFQKKCLDKIRSFQAEGRTIILVTHDLGVVPELCDRAVLIHHGDVVFDGDPKAAVSLFRDLLEGRQLDVEFSKRQPELAIVHAVTATVAPGKGNLKRITLGLDVEYRASMPLWFVVFQVDNAKGVPAFTARSYGTEFGNLEGRHQVTAAVAPVSLPPGEYTVNAFVLDRDGRHVMDELNATTFEIAGQAGAPVFQADADFRQLS